MILEESNFVGLASAFGRDALFDGMAKWCPNLILFHRVGRALKTFRSN